MPTSNEQFKDLYERIQSLDDTVLELKRAFNDHQDIIVKFGEALEAQALSTNRMAQMIERLYLDKFPRNQRYPGQPGYGSGPAS